MSMKGYLDGRKVVLTDDFTEWATKFEQNRRIGRCEAEIGGHKILVSTVFLGLEHCGGTWFETMVFIDGDPREEARHVTYEEAESFFNQCVDALDRFYGTKLPRQIRVLPNDTH